MVRTPLALLVCLSALLSGACASAGHGNGSRLVDGGQPSAGPALAVGNSPLAAARYLSEVFNEVSNRVGPSVVSIRSMSRRGFMSQQGSGVLVRADGVIVTNNHVVKGSNTIQVQLGDGRIYRAELLGTDPDTDLAILKIEARDLVAAPMEDSDVTAVGEWVLAMGNPLGLGHTVTAGIVSGLGHSGLDIAEYEDFIQTDAAINPGNSGGPLVDLAGRIVGINTAIGTRSAGSEGIAYAIPIRIVRMVLESILEDGVVERGSFGADLFDATTLSLFEAGFEGTSHAVVRRVREGSPAARSGFEQGDVITQFESKAIRTKNDLMNAVAESRPGTTVTIRFWRDGRDMRRDVTLN